MSDLFPRERGDQWDVWDTGFLPSPWIFWLWIGVYALQLIWFIYAFTIPCRTTCPLGLLYNVLTPAGFVLLSLSYGCTFAWIFVWDKLGFHQYSIACVAGASLFSFAALGVFARATSVHAHALLDQAPCDLWLVRLWVLNGIGAQATWTLMLLRYHAVIIIQSYTDLDLDLNLYVYLSLAAAFLVVWFFVDIFAVQRPLGFVFTPYVLPILASVTLLLRKGEFNELHFILTALVVALYGILMVVKIGVTIGRERAERTLSEEDSGKVEFDLDKTDIDTFHYVPVSPMDSPAKSENSREGSMERY